jgi:exonuclease III
MIYRVISLSIFTLFSINVALAGARFASYNIRNYGSKGGKHHKAITLEQEKTNNRKLAQILKTTSATLLGVQEIVDATKFKKFITNNFSQYSAVFSKCGGRGRQKLGFIYNKNELELLSFREDNRVSMNKGCRSGLRPAFIGKFKHVRTQKTFTALNFHLKAGGRLSNVLKRKDQYKIISTLIKEIRKKGSKNLVLFGDFNTTNYNLRNEHYQTFINFVQNNRLTDFAESLNCSSYWWGGVRDGLEYPSLLDHVMMSQEMKDLLGKKAKAQVLSHCQKSFCEATTARELGTSFKSVSDHCPVAVEFSKI